MKDAMQSFLYGMCAFGMVKADNERVLLRDGQVLDIEGIKAECFLAPGHTRGHTVHLIDDAYDESGDTKEKARGGWLKKAGMKA